MAFLDVLDVHHSTTALLPGILIGLEVLATCAASATGTSALLGFIISCPALAVVQSNGNCLNDSLQAANVARKQHGIHIKGTQAPAPLQVSHPSPLPPPPPPPPPSPSYHVKGRKAVYVIYWGCGWNCHQSTSTSQIERCSRHHLPAVHHCSDVVIVGPCGDSLLCSCRDLAHLVQQVCCLHALLRMSPV